VLPQIPVQYGFVVSQAVAEGTDRTEKLCEILAPEALSVLAPGDVLQGRLGVGSGWGRNRTLGRLAMVSAIYIHP
jgi:hypothetical protein